MKTTETYINKKTKAVLRIHNDAGFVELLEYKSNLFPQVIWDLSKAKEILKSWKSDAATKEQLIYKIKDQHGRTLCRTKTGYGFFFRSGIAWKTRKPAEKFLQIVKNWNDNSIPKIVEI